MAHSAHSSPQQLQEIIEPPDVVREKVRQIVSLWRSSRHTVVVTGAGMSTACGIKDYRSGVDTCLPTGPGVWTQAKAMAEAATAKAAVPSAPPSRRKGKKRKSCSTAQQKGAATALATSASIPPDIHKFDEQLEQSMLAAVPSYAHLALVELHRVGKLHQLITMNTDSLHEMSGLPASALVEIHGNQTVEQCVGCNRIYRRDGAVQSAAAAAKGQAHYTAAECARLHLRHLLHHDPSNPRWEGVDISEELRPDPDADATLNRSDHFSGQYTGRFCAVSSCREKLVDNVIEFERALYDDDHARCQAAFKKADLIIILGSSSVVDPVRKFIYNNLFKKVVQINLQRTEIDAHASVSLHCKIDDAFRELMSQMTPCRPINQPFILRRFLRVEQRHAAFDELEVRVTGLMGTEQDAQTIVLFRDVQMSLPSKKSSGRSGRASRRIRAPAAAAPEREYFESGHTVCEVTGCHSLRLKTLDRRPCSVISGQLNLLLQFMGHKKEPDFELCVDVALNKQTVVELDFDTAARTWMPLQRAPVWAPLQSGSSTRRSEFIGRARQ